MSNKHNLFRIIRAVGLLAIVALLLRSEWRFIHANLAGALNWRIQLYVVGSVLLLPHYWVALALALVGHFGKRRIDKRAAKAAQEESENPA
jgi:chromate transport protein ChrA